MAKFQEISFDVFLQVIWEDKRIKQKSDTNMTLKSFIELKIEERHKIWVCMKHYIRIEISFDFGNEIKLLNFNYTRCQICIYVN